MSAAGRPAARAVRLLAGDVRVGLTAMVPRLAVGLVLCAFLCFMLYARNRTALEPVGSLSFGDYACALFAGMREHVPSPSERFPLPAGWLCVCAFAAYATLDYPVRDLRGMGAHLVVASGGRWGWWCAKCCWVVLCVVVYWLAALGVCAVWTIATGGAFDCNVTPGVPDLLDFPAPELERIPTGIWETLLAVLAVLVAVCLVQLAVSLAAGPFVGLMATLAILFLSAFFMDPWLIGNYAMAARSDLMVANGVSAGMGAALALVVATAAVVLGGVVFRRLDIVGREADAQ